MPLKKKVDVGLGGANVDTCYKVFNKKADGSCAKLLKFVINSNDTTSQLLTTGSKTNIFINTILDKIGTVMKEKCSQLDVMNINIASVMNKAEEQEQLSAIKDKITVLQACNIPRGIFSMQRKSF